MLWRISFIIMLLIKSSSGELPSDLPGEEITQEFLNFSLPVDSTTRVTDKQQKTDTPSYSEAAEKTWSSPPLAEQLAADITNIPLGKGGVFIPRFTDRGNEPDIEIIDAEGAIIASGEPGITKTLEPGDYFAILGSGSHRHRLVRKFSVLETKVTPVIPDWSALTIETIDTNAIPFRGEYELVRIDEFEPFGRGFGADPNLGEPLNPWVLKPGIYKILGRGESYNTLINFITVRLLPGELTKIVLVQNPESMIILSGGTIDVAPGKKILSNWKYGANIGGNITINGENDRRDVQREEVITLLSLRTSIWLNFLKKPFEWESTLRLDEGFNISDYDLFELATAADELRIHSLFIWRFLSWFGPYGRTELRTNLLPRRKRIDTEKFDRFSILSNKAPITIQSFDSSDVYKMSPSFSPLTIDFGGGANFDVLSTRFIETKVQIGAGSSYNKFPNRFQSIELGELDSLDPLYAGIKNDLILKPEKSSQIFEFGPQGSISGNLRLGRLGTAGGEIKIFAPILPEQRFTRPDFDLIGTVSWRLAKAVTLDYDYTYQKKQPEKEDTKVDKSTHTLWLRFSYSSH